MSPTAEALPRTVTPAGWPLEVIGAISAPLAERLEALVSDVESPSRRLRPAADATQVNSTVRAHLLDPNGDPIPAKAAAGYLEAHAGLRGLSISMDGDDVIVFAMGPTAEASDEALAEAAADSPRSRRRRDA